ncbi:glycosyltransferase family 4 protein [Parapedobacter tibetensis]|uniref:glycosyltransferase family 4 protein n=1 Tax=Parapedobacter tibetensis TaxID=2972951 RepID=UPI00214D7E43|nr:glycosyltransferase family 1 protein [Parapedobacter tibetensis]
MKRKRPKRIGIEVQRLFRPKKHGMEVVALELVRELQVMDRYNEYTLFVKNDADWCIEESANVKIRALDARPYPIWEQISLPLSAKSAQLDILHSTCNTSTLFPPVPLVLTLHDIIYLEKLDMAGTLYQNFGNVYRRLVVPAIARKAAAIITVSEFERSVMVDRLDIPEEKVKVIHNAVHNRFNNRYAHDQVEAFRKSKGLPAHFLLFLGNTAPKKNTKNVIEAYVRYVYMVASPLPIVVLDYSEKLVVDQLLTLGAADLFSNFIFPGYIHPDNMPLIYNASTLFVYPSLRESFGLPILEAMACGVPVITSNTSAMPEVAGDAAVLVNPSDTLALAEAMQHILDNPDVKKELVAKGLKRATEFTWRNAALKLLNLYETI